MALRIFREIIPIRLKIDTSPLALAEGSDAVWVVDQEMPRSLAGIDDGFVAVPNLGAEFVLTQVLPDILHRVEFRAVRRQRQHADVVGMRNSPPL